LLAECLGDSLLDAVYWCKIWNLYTALNYNTRLRDGQPTSQCSIHFTILKSMIRLLDAGSLIQIRNNFTALEPSP
jgi:hypothetical protein